MCEQFELCSSSSRPQHETELDDLCRAFDCINFKELLNNVRFAAEKLDHLPNFSPEEINICASLTIIV